MDYLFDCFYVFGLHDVFSNVNKPNLGRDQVAVNIEAGGHRYSIGVEAYQDFDCS